MLLFSKWNDKKPINSAGRCRTGLTIVQKRASPLYCYVASNIKPFPSFLLIAVQTFIYPFGLSPISQPPLTSGSSSQRGRKNETSALDGKLLNEQVNDGFSNPWKRIVSWSQRLLRWSVLLYTLKFFLHYTFSILCSLWFLRVSICILCIFSSCQCSTNAWKSTAPEINL